MQTFLEVGLSNAVMATALALLAAGVGLFCRRPAVMHVLWLLVLLKLITPPVMPVPVACPSALEAVLPGRDAVRLCVQPSAPERGDPGGAAAHDLAGQGGEDFVLDSRHSSAGAADAPLYRSASNEEEEPSVATPVSGLAASSFLPIIFAVWLTGSVLWFAVAGTRVYRFHRLLRYGRPASVPLQEQTRLLAQHLGLARCPRVWLVPGRVSPLLWALGRRLYLVVPAELLGRLGPEQQASLLAHELAHARRRDHWVRWLELVVTGLYWWLPVAWWARRRLQQAEEECCDAWVVWTLPAAAKAYAKALLQTVDFLDARPALPPVASGIGHVHPLRRRLTMIVRQPLYPRLPWPVHVGAIVLGLFILPAAPQRLEAQSSDAKPDAALAEDTAVASADQETPSRDLERRLRTLEEKMDRLLQKLDAQRGELSEGRAPKEGRNPAAEERAKAKEKAFDKGKEAAKEKDKADRLKEPKLWKETDGKTMTPEQIKQLKEEIHEKVSKAFDPERMKELQQKVQEAVNKSVNPERMKELEKRIQEAVNKSVSPERMETITRQVEEALKKSSDQLGKAKQRLQQAEQPRANEPRQVTPPRFTRPERSRNQEQHDLERRMDRLEQKMDRVIQALEKPGKRSR